MDNKNEKTFSDLFLDASDIENDDLEGNKVTFDSLSNNMEDEVISDNVSFNMISNIDNSESDILDNNLVNNISFNQINENSNDSNKDNEDSLIKIENPFINEDDSEVKEEVIEVNPFISENAPEFKGDVIETNPFINEDESEVKDDVIETNPFINREGSEFKEEVLEVNPFINKEESEFEEEVLEVNPFVSEEKIESQSEVSNNEFNSPFFDSDNFIDGSNSLLNNSISLEGNGVGNSINKLDLNNVKHFDVKVVAKKEPLSKFIVGVISYAFFIWLLLIGITLLVYVLDIKIRAAKGDYSAPTFNAYVVLTGSMLPEIQVNDVVVTKKVDAEELDVGDIITFASADSRFLGTVITHRIIKKNQDKEGNITFQTQGDNNNVADNALVPEANIFGRVILKIPKLGYLQEFLATDGGWIIVILIPCLAVISYDIVKIAKGVKKKKNNNIKIQSR